MKKLLSLTAALLMVTSMTAANETIVLRIKGMWCEECGHKVSTAVRKLAGIGKMDFDFEKRTVAVEYDPVQTCADSIRARLAATGRYKSIPYDKNEVIRRGMGLRMDDMHCQNCADRIMKRLETIEGVDSMSPHIDKQYMFIRYDANKTCKKVIREALEELGFTPVNYYTSQDISFAYFLIPKEACNEETLEEVLIMDGVDDVNVNDKRGSLAITFMNKETSVEKLLQAIQAAGIKATVPEPHECKENK